MAPRIAIIGAGLSGLSAARHLSKNLPCSLHIFEKSRSVSGRCATKTNFSTTPLDHGPPYFVLSPTVQSIVPELVENLVRLPPDAIQTPSLQIIPQNAPLYYMQDGNAGLGKLLFPGAIITRATVKKVQPDGRMHIIRYGKEDIETIGPFDYVICTAPLPQAADILQVDEEIAAKWKAFFVPQLTALLEYDLTVVPLKSPAHAAASGLPPYAISDKIWAGCETYKRGGPEGRVVFVGHATEEFSRRHLEDEGENWLPLIRKEVETLWSINENARVQAFAKRWRYAKVKGGAASEKDIENGKIFLTGDGVGQNDLQYDGVERAILNGLKVAGRILRAAGG